VPVTYDTLTKGKLAEYRMETYRLQRLMVRHEESNVQR